MDKYEGCYLEHYLAMYASNFSDENNRIMLNRASFEEMICLYKSFEGEENFLALKREIKEVQINHDWAYFAERLADDFDSPLVVKQIAEFVLNYK